MMRHRAHRGAHAAVDRDAKHERIVAQVEETLCHSDRRRCRDEERDRVAMIEGLVAAAKLFQVLTAKMRAVAKRAIVPRAWFQEHVTEAQRPDRKLGPIEGKGEAHAFACLRNGQGFLNEAEARWDARAHDDRVLGRFDGRVDALEIGDLGLSRRFENEVPAEPVGRPSHVVEVPVRDGSKERLTRPLREHKVLDAEPLSHVQNDVHVRRRHGQKARAAFNGRAVFTQGIAV